MRIGSAATDGDWFARRFAHARALVPAADFDTVIPADFGETVTSQLADVVGVADASPDFFYNGGVVDVAVGDAVIAPSSARLELTGSPSHVGNLAVKPWYMAALVLYVQPLDATQLADTQADAIGLWSDDSNTVGLGVMGQGSGGSTAKWVGHVVNAGNVFTRLGPNLDPAEAPVWHLFESWHDGALVHFMLDGVEFDDTIPTAQVPGVPAKLGMVTKRDTIGDQALVNYDKACVVMTSPQVGQPS